MIDARPDQDPGPRTQDVVRHVEEEDRPERVVLGLGRQHALRNVAAPARLRPGIPDGPPLNGDRHDEDRNRQVPVVGEVGEYVQVVDAARPRRDREFVDQALQAADRGQLECEIGRRDHGRHLDEELDHVDDQHAPEAGVGRENHVEHAHQEQRLPAFEAEEDSRDLAGRQVHGGHDHAVEEQAEVNRPETADDACRLPRVAHLVEFEIRHDAGTPPQTRIEKHRRYPGQDECPPDPVPGDAVAAHDVGHKVRRVAAEGGGDHRQARQPPRDGATGYEELRSALAGALAEEQGREEADDQGEGDDNPVDQLQVPAIAAISPTRTEKP